MHGFGPDARNYRHGHKPADAPASPEYTAWLNMKARCNNPEGSSYARYGAIGVKVCPEWQDDFVAFLNHIGPRPSEAHSVDRYPNKHGNYEPGNVRWATSVEQANNRKSNRLLTHDGETRTMAEWAKLKGIKLTTLHARLDYYGWSVDRALTAEVR